MAIFTVDYDCGQKVYSAPSKEVLIEHLKKNDGYFVWCCIDEKQINESIKEVELDTKEPVQYIGGYVE